jgi:hypothetical protein
MRLSRLALILLRGYAALTAFALILGWPLVAAGIGMTGLVNIGVIGGQLVGFGRLMHRIVEAVAKQARLVPLEPARHPQPRILRLHKWGNPAATSCSTSEPPLVRE